MTSRITFTSSKVLWLSWIVIVHGLLLFVLLYLVDATPHQPLEIGTSVVMIANIADSTMDGRLDAKPAILALSESASTELPEITPVMPSEATSTAAVEAVAFSQAEPDEQADSFSTPLLTGNCTCPSTDGQVAVDSCEPPRKSSACPRPPVI